MDSTKSKGKKESRKQRQQQDTSGPPASVDSVQSQVQSSQKRHLHRGYLPQYDLHYGIQWRGNTLRTILFLCLLSWHGAFAVGYFRIFQSIDFTLYYTTILYEKDSGQMVWLRTRANIRFSRVENKKVVLKAHLADRSRVQPLASHCYNIIC